MPLSALFSVRDGAYRAERATRAREMPLEYYQGNRPSPRTDRERQSILTSEYMARRRLHRYCLHTDADIIQSIRAAIRTRWQGLQELSMIFGHPVSQNRSIPPVDFEEMLNRQAEMDRTGQPITDADRYYSLE